MMIGNADVRRTPPAGVPRWTSTWRYFLILVSCTCVGRVMLAAEAMKDPVCQVILDAMTKTLQTPVHAYSTIGYLGDGLAPRQIEGITIGAMSYAKIDGKWTVDKARPSMADFRDQMTRLPEAMQCQYEREDVFEGEASSVYKMRLREGEKHDVVTETWISKTRGLMLHTIMDITVNGTRTHTSTRYSYTDVKAPLEMKDQTQ